MTAEIGILNRNGVVLAADSASTIEVGNMKKFVITEKLFALSNNHSVGIMVYANARFSNIPWETVIKIYRSYIGCNPFDTIQEYAEDFFDFLLNDKRIYDSSYENELVELVLKSCLTENYIDFKSRQGKTLSEEIENKVKSLSEKKFLDGFDDSFIRLFLEKHKRHLMVYMNDNVNISIDNKTQENIILLCAYTISKSNYLFEYKPSGIVIAGYGSKEVLPALNEYIIIGIISGKLIYKLKDRVNIDYNISAPQIIPFAQTDVVETFTKGIDPEIHNKVSSKINMIFDNFFDVIQSEANAGLDDEFSSKYRDIINDVGGKLKNKIKESFSSSQKEKYIDSFEAMIPFLGKEEMTSMAEALVNLTSTKHRFTAEEEDVGGPTDVAIITKGEGFKWIKRKSFIKTKFNIGGFYRR